jgi:hypothetical protein
MLLLLAAMTMAGPPPPPAEKPAAILVIGSEARQETAGALLQVDPTIGLFGGSEGLSLAAKYEPRFLVESPDSDRSLLQLHRLAANATWRADTGTWVEVQERLLYGRQDYSWLTQLAEDPAPNFSRLPLARSLLTMEATTAASLRRRLESHLELGASAGWSVSGGADDDARTFLPLIHGFTGSVSGAWTRSRDRVSIRIEGGHSIVTGVAGNVLGATADWQHVSSAGAVFAGSIGVSQAFGTLQQGTFPTGGLSLRIEPVPDRRRFGGTVSVLAQPSPDPQTGQLVARLIGTAGGSFLATRSLTFSVLGGLARTTSGNFNSRTDWQASTTASWAVGRQLQLSIGGRTVSEPDRQWAAFVALRAWRRDVF